MKKVKISTLFDFLPKSKIKAGDGLLEGLYPFYTSSNIQSKFINEYQNKPGCLVFGTGGKPSVHLTKSKFSTSTDCITIKPKVNTEIDVNYVYQYIKNNMLILEKGFKGAGLKHISKIYLSNIEIPLPPLKEQKRIAKLLGKVENLIIQRKENLKQLDELLKSVFLDMFGDPVKNEKGWKKEKLSNLLSNIESGWSTKCEASSASEQEWGILKLGAISSGKFKPQENKALLANVKPRTQHEIKVGDLLFTRKNTHALVGKTAFVFKTRTKLLMPDLIFRLVIRETNMLNPLFLWRLLSNSSQLRKIQSLASGAAGSMPNISKVKLNNVLIIIPPISLQKKHSKYVKKIEKLKAQYQKSLKELENLYGSLSQKAFKGELDLSKVNTSPFKQANTNIKTPKRIKSALQKLNEINNRTANASYFDAINKNYRSLNFNTIIDDYTKKLAEFRSPLEQFSHLNDYSDLIESARASISGQNLNLEREMAEAQLSLNDIRHELDQELNIASDIAKDLANSITNPDIEWLQNHETALEVALKPFDTMQESIGKLQGVNLMDQHQEILESLNEFNNKNTIDALLGATKLEDLALNHKDMLLEISEQMKKFETPFEQLNHMSELASSMTNASEIMNNLGVELSTLDKSAEIARSIVDAIPTAEIKHMEKSPVIKDYVEEAFASKQELLSQKLTMTSKELLKLMQLLKKPFKFQTLLDDIKKDNHVDLDGYELIKSFLVVFIDNKTLVQKYDEQNKCLVFEFKKSEVVA